MRLLRRNTPNNNKEVIKLLARESLKHHKGRNTILAGTAALGIVVLCTVFSIALGKIDAEYLQSVRSSGTAATTCLERGTMEQYEAVRGLDYINAVGRMKGAGDAFQKGEFVCALESVDQTAWEEMLRPAYTHIHGHYPEKDGEIMLPVRSLEALGIREPEEGMELAFTVLDEEEHEREETFVLGGWYKDYTDPAVSPPVGYISEGRLESMGMSLKKPDLLLIQQKNTIDGYEIEERLYRDIPTIDKAQQFLGGNTLAYSIINDFAGGYGMAAFCGLLVLASVFFLIQNIMSISIQREIRQIGLLDTIGMTQRQIRNFYFRQTLVLLCLGTAAGIIGALFAVLIIVPRALGNLYLYNFGRSSELLVFRPELFAAAVIFTALVLLAASAAAVHKAACLTPLEALHYTGLSERSVKKHRKYRKKAKRAETGRGMANRRKIPGQGMVFEELFFMAWQNLLRYRKRFLLTVFSLFLGITTALGSVVLARGTDYTNSIEKEKDFSIDGNPGILMGDMKAYRDDFSIISDEVKERVLSVRGVQENSVEIVRGAYMAADEEELAWSPFISAESPDEAQKTDSGTSEEEGRSEEERTGEEEKTGGEERTGEEAETGGDQKETEENSETVRQPVSPVVVTVQTIGEEYIQELEEYAAENNLEADFKSLRDGTGMLMLHYHMLSPALMEEADRLVGTPVTLWRLPDAQESEKAAETAGDAFTPEVFTYREGCEMTAAGYFDTQAKNFPKFRRTWFGPDIWYVLVNEEGFARLGTKEKTFHIEYNTKEDQEPSAKAALRQILQEENRKQGKDSLYVNCKSDTLADAQSYIMTNRIIMGALSFVLILMGILNYFNVLVTGMSARQKELAVMESVGMTGRQMKVMLAAEGGIYCGIILLLTVTAGSGILKMLHLYMDSRIAYFKFIYPWSETGVILLGLLLICIGVPMLVYKYMDRQSLTVRIVTGQAS